MNHLANLGCQLASRYERYSDHVNDEIRDLFSVKRHPIMYLRPGYILRVKLEGFLTHKYKVVDFTHPVTLIHGPNGSGKSSILQALHFVLLGNHGAIRDGVKSFEEFRMRGTGEADEVVAARQASVTVYFAQPFILRRNITGRTTKFFRGDFNGKNVKMLSISQKEVATILQELQHFPNNKVTMVTQHEMKIQARMAPKNRFSLFYSASMLEDIVQTYQHTYGHVENIYENIKKLYTNYTKKLQEKDNIDKEVKNNIEKLNKLIQASRYNIYKNSIDYFFKVCDILRLKCYLITKQKDKHKYEQQIRDYQLQLENIELQRQQKKNQLDNIIKNIQVLETNKQNISQQITQAQNRCQQRYLDIQMKKDMIKQYQNKAITLENNIEKCEQLIQRKDEIDAEEYKYANYNLELPEQLVVIKQNIIQQEKQYNELQDQQNRLKHKVNDILMQISGYNAKKVNMESELESHEKQLDLLKVQLKNKEHQQNNNQQVIDNLNNDDRQTYNFLKQHKLKIYLVSAEIYLEVKDERIQSTIQRYLSPQSIGFLCVTESEKNECEKQFNKQSSEYYQFQTIKSKYQIQTQVSKIQFQSIKNRLKQIKNMQSTQIHYLPDLLNIQNDVCMAALILQRRIDKVIIINSISDARSILEEQNDLIILPLDAKSVISYQNGTLSSQPLYDQAAGQQPGQSSIFCVNKNDVVEIQRQIHQKEVQIEELKIQLEHFTNDVQNIQSLNQQKETLENEIKQLLEKNMNLNQEIQEQRNQLDPIQNAYDNENAEYQKQRQNWIIQRDDLQQAYEQKQKYADQLERNSFQMQKLKQEIEIFTNDEENIEKREVERLQGELKITNQDLEKQYQLKQETIDNIDLITNGKIQQQMEKTEKDLHTLVQLIESKNNEHRRQEENDLYELIKIESSLPQKLKIIKRGEKENETILKLLVNEDMQQVIISVAKFVLQGLDSGSQEGESIQQFTEMLTYYQLTKQISNENNKSQRYSITYNEQFLTENIEYCTQIVAQLKTQLQLKHVDIQNTLIELQKNYEALDNQDETQMNDLLDQLKQCTEEIERLHNQYEQNKQKLRDLITKLAKQTMKLSQLRMQCQELLAVQFNKHMKIMGLSATLHIQMPPLPRLESYGLDPTYVLQEQELKHYQQYTHGIHNNQHSESSNNLKDFLTGQIDIKVNDRSVTTLSGGEGTRTALGFITACCNVIQSCYLQIDEWDVYLDAEKRAAAFAVLLDVIAHTNLQCVFVTPNDVDMKDGNLKKEVASLVGVVRLQSVLRSTEQ